MIHQNIHTPTFPRSASLLLRGITLIAGLALLCGCRTIPRKTFEEKYPLRARYSPRWETNEVPYDEAPIQDKIGRNVRDGLTGVINNWVQGFFAGFSISPTSGYVVQKGATMVGDVFGLVDDNEITEHVFVGIISRQFLRFGSTAQDFPGKMSAIHDTTFDDPKLQTLDFVGPDTFHTKVYGRPSAIFSLGAVVVSDLLVRPAGNFTLMFGGRDIQKKIDQKGLDLIQAGMDVPFL